MNLQRFSTNCIFLKKRKPFPFPQARPLFFSPASILIRPTRGPTREPEQAQGHWPKTCSAASWPADGGAPAMAKMTTRGDSGKTATSNTIQTPLRTCLAWPMEENRLRPSCIRTWRTAETDTPAKRCSGGSSKINAKLVTWLAKGAHHEHGYMLGCSGKAAEVIPPWRRRLQQSGHGGGGAFRGDMRMKRNKVTSGSIADSRTAQSLREKMGTAPT
jgi:hypothetical protein